MSKYLSSTKINTVSGTNTVSTTLGGKSATQVTYSAPSLPFTDSNLVLFYSFKDAVTTDNSANGYTLTNNAAVTQIDVTDSTNGITLYNSAGFNGTTQYLSRNTASDSVLRAAFTASAGFYTSGYVFSAWIYNQNAATSGECFCANSNTGLVFIGTDQVFTIYYNGSGSIVISVNGTFASPYLLASYAINQSQWYHVVFVLSMGGNTLYINGNPVTMSYSTGSSVTGLTQSLLTNINRVYIGNRGTTNYWSGYMKNVIFTSTVWTSDQIKQVYYSQLHDINSFNNSFIGFNNDTATGILRQKNSTMSILSGGQSSIDITTSATTMKSIINNSIASSGVLCGNVYSSDTILNEPPTLSSNIQSFTNNVGVVYIYEVSSSSVFSGATSSFAAFDNNTGTYFADNSSGYNSTTGVASSPSTIIDSVTYSGSWLQIDMGRRITFASFTILPRSGFETTRAPNLFYMCGSNDNSTWSSIYTSTLNSITWSSSTQTFTISTAHSYRYYRIVASVVGNSGVSSGRSGFNIAQLTFTRKANVILNGCTSIGSDSTNYLNYASSAKDGLILGIPSLTYTDSSVAGTLANANIFSIRQPTFTASNARTTTNATTMYIEGAPIKGTNETFTNAYGMYIDNTNSTTATVTEAASFYISGAPVVTSGTTYAMKIASGKLYIGGSLQIATGATNGYVLTSDGQGNGVWAAASGGVAGGFGDGLFDTPSIYFIAESGTGLYRPASGQIGIELNGANYATFTTSGLNFINGTALNVGASGTTSSLNVYGLITGNNGLTISSGNVNLSGSSGTFATPTGAVTIGSGAVGITGTATFSGATNAILASGSGAINFSGNSGTFATPTGAVTLGTGAITTTGDLNINKNLIFGIVTITGTSSPQTISTTTSSSLIILNPTGAITLNLPSSPAAGLVYKLLNVSTFTVTLSTNSGSVYFDGNTSITTINMSQYDRINLVYYSNNWFTF